MKIKDFFVVLFCLSLPGINHLYGQDISQSVIGSAGTYAESAGGSMAWTIGEVTIETFSSTDFFFTQGFHQPESREVPVVPIDFHIPEGFSPNGDDVNDLFVIRGITMYPHNSIIVFNRWGNKVFTAGPYQNSWDGTCIYGVSAGGDELPVGTYFYVFDFGDGTKNIKGTIYLNR